MTKFNYLKALRSVKELAIAFLIITVVLKLFGLQDFAINIDNENILNVIDTVNDNTPMRILINVLMGVFSINLMYACIVKDYIKHLILYNVIIVSYQIVSNILIYNDITIVITSILSFGMYFTPLMTTKKISLCLKILIIDIAFAQFSNFTKINSFDYNANFMVMMIVYLDYYLLWLLLNVERRIKLCYGSGQVLDFSETKNVYKTKFKSIKLNWLMQKLYKNVSILKVKLQNIKKNFVGYVRVDLKDDLIFKILPAFIVFSCYGLYARMTDKFVEAILLYFAYLHLRKLFPKHFHADYIPGIRENLIGIVCIVLSATTLCITLHNTTNSNLSIFSSIISAFIVNWLLYVVRDWLDYRVELPFIDKLKVKYEADFSKYGFTSEMSKFAYDYKVNKLSIKEQMEVTGLTKQTVKNYRSKVNKTIDKFNEK